MYQITKCKGKGCLLRSTCQLYIFDEWGQDGNAMDHCDEETRDCYTESRK